MKLRCGVLLSMNMVAVIMAGGRGQRFWPLSTEDKPKQFLDLERCGSTLLQSTVARVLPLVGSLDKILVATAQRYVPLVREQLPDLPEDNILIEPVARDSAPAVAYAALVVQERFGDVVMGIFSSDHRIKDGERFRQTIRQATQLAQTDGLVTIGITPTWPSTGYGYIQAGDQVEHGGFRVQKFAEKPNTQKAQAYLETGGFFWNAGIFVWRSSVILQELDRYAADLMAPLRQAVQEDCVEQVFADLKKISIDFAVMEHTKRALVIPGDFDWDDIGDWVALERLLRQGDENPNTVVGTHVGLETQGNIIYTENQDDVIVTLGVENLVIVKRGNVLLLMHKDRVQDIKQVLEDERLADVVLG